MDSQPLGGDDAVPAATRLAIQEAVALVGVFDVVVILLTLCWKGGPVGEPG